MVTTILDSSRSVELFSLVLHHVQELVFIHFPEGEIVWMNRAAEDALGAPGNEFAGELINMLVVREMTGANGDKYQSEGTHRVAFLRHREGRLIPIEVWEVSHSKAPEGLVVTFAKLIIETGGPSTHEKIRAIVTQTGLGFWEWTPTQVRSVPMAGYDDAMIDVHGNDFGDWIKNVHPDDQEGVQSDLEKVRGGQQKAFFRIIRAIDRYGAWLRIHILTVVTGWDADLHAPTGIFSIIQSVSDQEKRTKSLLEREQNLPTARRAAHTGSWDLNLKTKELWSSDEVYQLFGIPPGEFGFSYASFLARVPVEDRAQVEKFNATVMAERRENTITHRIVRQDGEIRCVQDRLGVITDSTGEITHLVGTFQDITDQLESEQGTRLRNRVSEVLLTCHDETAYPTVLSIILDEMKSPVGVLGYHPWGNIAHQATTPGAKLLAVDYPCKVSRSTIAANKDNATSEEQPLPFMVRGSEDDFISADMLCDGRLIGAITIGNNPNGYSGRERRLLNAIAQYIAPSLSSRLQRKSEERHRKIVELQLRESEWQLAEAQRIARIGSFTYEFPIDYILQGQITRVTKEMYNILRQTPAADEHGVSIDDFFSRLHPEDAQRAIQELETRVQRIRSSDTIFPIIATYRYTREDGKLRFLYTRVELHFADTKGMLQAVVVVQDVTTLRQMRDRVKETGTRFRDLFENAPITYLCLDGTGQILDANKEWPIMSGYPLPETHRRSFGDFWVEEARPLFPLRLERLKNVGADQRELYLVRKDGKEITVMFSGRVQDDPTTGETRIHCMLLDLTQQKQVEGRLRESSDRFKTIIDNVPLPLALVSGCVLGEARAKLVNNAFLELFQFSRDNVYEDVLNLNGEEDFQAQTLAKELCRGGMQAGREIKLRKKDGTVFYGLVSIETIEFNHETVSLVVIYDLTQRKCEEDELKRRSEEAEEFNRLLVDGVMRHIELKQEVNQALALAGLPPRYKLEWDQQGKE